MGFEGQIPPISLKPDHGVNPSGTASETKTPVEGARATCFADARPGGPSSPAQWGQGLGIGCRVSVPHPSRPRPTSVPTGVGTRAVPAPSPRYHGRVGFAEER